ncbi:MAG: hypothetical protein Q9222_003660 [Ikaeria aurantiellina]
MPSVYATIEYLADIPLYHHEKPYLVLASAQKELVADLRTNNLEWETHENILLTDIREHWQSITIDRYGFQVVNHNSGFLDFDTLPSLHKYQRETEELLRQQFPSSYVVCYDLKNVNELRLRSKLRKNTDFQRSTIDLRDPFLVEGPAKGAHSGVEEYCPLIEADVTLTSGPQIIDRYLSEGDKAKYFKPGSLVPELEDRPLALCDYQSIDREDLIEADRVFPDRVGEVYYLRYNQRQRWFWLEHQGLDELFLFTMYDTMAGNQAKYCPHVSFDNPRASPKAVPRRSVETRSIIISEVD